MGSKIAEKKNMSVPEFYSSTAYKKLNNTILSTSNCGNPSLRLFGFGPVVHDGFGIGYIIRDSGIQYSISSKHRQTERFAHTLKQTLIDMGMLLQPLSCVKVACNACTPVATKEKIAPKENVFVKAHDDVKMQSTSATGQQEKTRTKARKGSTSFARVLKRQ